MRREKQINKACKFYLSTLCFVFLQLAVWAQGYNHGCLLCYDYSPNSIKARLNFDASGYTLLSEPRKMPFQGYTQANISDQNGNMLMYTNGVWIADASGDTMMNGSGLNPSPLTTSWINGMPMPYSNIFLPYPGDTSKTVLIHHTAVFNGTYNWNTEVLSTLIDHSLNNGLGAVISKNDTILKDTLNWGVAACKHANGRDWWIVALKDSTDIIFKMLLTPTGIASVDTQKLNVPLAWGNVTQYTFSQDGTKFVYNTSVPAQPDSCYVLLFDFDRCSGMFSNEKVIFVNQGYLWGMAFSSSGNYIYTNTSQRVFQINTATLALDTVAFYDGYNSPFTWCCPTIFHLMYLAANGKIYISCGNGVQHIHEINYPDSSGLACDIQQHAIQLNCYNINATPNHPNYYLGPITGSVCDSLTGIAPDPANDDLRFRLYPNPVTNSVFNIGYLLPPNKSGRFEVYDITGALIFGYTLPPWSNEHGFVLPGLSNGIYNCILTSGAYRVSKRMVVAN